MLSVWHQRVGRQGHVIVAQVKEDILRALNCRQDLSCHVQGYDIQGRTKGLVSTFRKVFRQNKRADEVHDLVGLRIVVTPSIPQREAEDVKPPVAGSEKRIKLATVSSDSACTPSLRDDNRSGEHGEWEGICETTELSRIGEVSRDVICVEAGKVFSSSTYPPPYLDSDSCLLHDVYHVVTSLFSEVPGRYKNYVDFPKRNGYRSLHTTVSHPDGLMIEVQIRTKSMHMEAENGAAAHSLYKGALQDPTDALAFRSKMQSQPPLSTTRNTS
ncbi:unnamed protein product [Choristocarpus tenellus]